MICLTNKNIKFEIHGNEMEAGYNLHYVVKSLSEFHSILDKAYLVLSDKVKMSESDRNFYQVKMISVNKGSFIADLSLSFMAAYQTTFPFVASLSPKGIWEITLQGYEYLRFVFDAFHKGETIKIENGDNNMVTVVRGNNNSIKIHPITIQLVGNATNEYQDLVNNIGSGRGIDKISIKEKTKEGNGIFIDAQDKELFQSSKVVDEVPAKFLGKIFRIDGHSCTGRLSVLNSYDKDVLEGKDYSFDLINKEDIALCNSVFMEETEIVALKELNFNPTSLTNSVIRLKIYKILPGHKSFSPSI